MMITTRMMMPEGKNREQLKAKLSELLKSRQKRCSPTLSSASETGLAVTSEIRLKKRDTKWFYYYIIFTHLNKKRILLI